MAFVPLIPEEENNDRSWYTTGAAGIASGIIKVPEGIVSLAAELIDLGLDSNTAAGVEQFFDTLNPFEEIAEQHGAGKLTEALVSIGIPSTVGFKQGSRLAKKVLKARREGNAISAGSKNMIRQGMKADSLNKKVGAIRFGAGVIGGAAGETLVADVEEIGSFGDMFDSGPTVLNRLNSEGREDATRKLMNRLKFGSESLLITPFAAGIGKGAKALATRGKDLAYSNYKLERFLGKFAQAFTPEGPLTKAVFGSQKVMEGFRSADVNRATELIRKLDTNLSKAFPQMQSVLDRSLTNKEKDVFLKEINELMFDGDLTKLIDGKKSDAFVKALKDKGVDQKVIDSIVGTVDEARSTIGNLIKTTNNYNSKELKDILQDRIKGLTQNTYKIFETSPVLGIFGRYRPTDDSMAEAIDFFRQQIAGTNKDKTFKLDSDTYYEEAKNIVERILEDGIKAKKTGRGLADPNYCLLYTSPSPRD